MLVSPTTVEAVYAAAPKDRSAWLAGLQLGTKINGIDALSTAFRQVVDGCHERPIAAGPETDHAHLDRAATVASAAFRSWSAEAWQTRHGTVEQSAKLLLAPDYEMSSLHG